MAEVYLFKVNYAIRFIKNIDKAGLAGPFVQEGDWKYLECYVFADEAAEAERLTKENLETVHQNCQIKIIVYQQLAAFDADNLPAAGQTVHCISLKGVVSFEMPTFF